MSATMSLTGTFDAPDFGEVLALLSRRACTGRFQVRAGSRHAVIRLFEGNAVGLEGFTTSWSDGHEDLQSCLEEACFEVLRAGRGSFEFQADQAAGDQGASPVAPGRGVALAPVVEAAEERLAEWREVEAVIPSLDSVPRLAEGLRCRELVLSQEQWRVIVSIDGRRSVGGIARRLALKPAAVCRTLKPLVEDGAVSLDRNEPVARVDPSAPRPADEPTAPAGASERPVSGPASSSVLARTRTKAPAFRVVARSGETPTGAPAPS